MPTSDSTGTSRSTTSFSSRYTRIHDCLVNEKTQ